MPKRDARITLLLKQADQSFNRRSWHGTNLRGALRNVTAQEAVWRPGSGRRNIWEYLLHSAYYTYAVARVLEDAKERGTFPRKPSGWPRLPGVPDQKAWAADVRLLEEQYQRFRAALENLDPRKLDQKRGKWTYAEHAFGLANHDLYHAGQIQLLKRLLRANRKT